MSTARDLIKGSLRLIGAIASGETPSADEQADGLSALNDMLDSWSLERLVVPVRTREEFTVSTSPVSMGDGATLDSARPMRIDAASVIVGGVERKLDILSPEEWQAIAQKQMTSTIPLKLYAEGSSPDESINLWPIPSGPVTLVLYSWKSLGRLASANADIEFPEGYLRALRYNLAVEMAPEYGKAITDDVRAIAIEAKANIKRMNKRPVHMISDASGLPSGGVGRDMMKFLRGE